MSLLLLFAGSGQQGVIVTFDHACERTLTCVDPLRTVRSTAPIRTMTSTAPRRTVDCLED